MNVRRTGGGDPCPIGVSGAIRAESSQVLTRGWAAARRSLLRPCRRSGAGGWSPVRDFLGIEAKDPANGSEAKRLTRVGVRLAGHSLLLRTGHRL
jgi:hypothetical protein